ncbi:MAG: hypothetical protein Q7U87_00590 [bacterium]|nr:hypothetical protein [bacterium]
MNHEEPFVTAFIVKDKKQRYLELFKTTKGRIKVNKCLAHNPDIDNRYMFKVPNSEQTPDKIFKLLKSKNAPEYCHVISEDTTIDNMDLLLKDALFLILGKGSGTIISCIPGKLAYYEGEDPQERYILSNLK